MTTLRKITNDSVPFVLNENVFFLNSSASSADPLKTSLKQTVCTVWVHTVLSVGRTYSLTVSI